jgi:AcrR family transcriptional regulator
MVRVCAHRDPEPGSEHDGVSPVARQRLAHDLLGLSGGVAVGGVDEVDAGIQCPVDDSDRVGVVGVAEGAEHHAAEAELADVHPRAPERSVLHNALLRVPQPRLGAALARIELAGGEPVHFYRSGKWRCCPVAEGTRTPARLEYVLPQQHPQPPTRRSDAERNRAKILAAAGEAFADSQLDVSMAEISRRAGVGMGTLYRNFPGKRELLEALFNEETDTVCAAAATVQGETAGERCFAWLSEFFSFFSNKRHIASKLLEHTDRTNPLFSDNRSRVIAAGAPLLDAAQRSGEIRPNLSIEQILDMVHAIATIQADATYVEPILRAALDGLRV